MELIPGTTRQQTIIGGDIFGNKTQIKAQTTFRKKNTALLHRLEVCTGMGMAGIPRNPRVWV